MAGEEFAGAGEKDGIMIWRIEKMVPTPVPEAQHGRFFDGDSYIVLHQKSSSSGAKELNIHFWLGSESSQDERGVAAYKTKELDDKLGGGAKQYREVQEHESAEFSAIFRAAGGIEYLKGGVDSGFTHVERDSYDTRLLQIKGRRNVRVKQVETKATAMNQGDVFILDMGLKLFLWTGAEANRYEKAKGIQTLTKIRNERGARPEAIVVADDPDNEEFWGALGGTVADVKSAEEGGDDKEAETGTIKLYNVSDESGTLQVTEVERVDGKLKREMLDTKDVFILDNESAIWVWIGKGATAEEKKNGMKIGTDYLTKQSRPDWTPVSRVVEGGEDASFKSCFGEWEVHSPVDFTQMYKSSGVAGAEGREIEIKEVDITAMHRAAAEETAEELDDGSGELTIWRIESFDKKLVPESLRGQFYAGDSYIVLYKYKERGSDAAVVYFWQGLKSSTDEKGAAALMAKDVAGEQACKAPLIRVVQAKEPSHFCNLFKGQMIVHAGGVAGAFDSADAGKEAEAAAAEANGLYHVKGSRPGNTKGVEVDAKASNLNSGDCFVLRTDDRIVVWHGKGSNDQEKASSDAIADVLKGSLEVTKLEEGSEDDAFWDALGGKAEYASSPSLADLPHEPRLFQISNVTGQIAVEEIPNFSQDDLLDEDVMLLDTFNEVFCWIGSQSHEEEKKEGPALAQKYIDAATDGREGTALIVVEAGGEPSIFTAHFHPWDYDKAAIFEDPYEKRLRQLREAKEAAAAAAPDPKAALKKTSPKKADDDGAAAAASGSGAGAGAEAPAAAAADRPTTAPVTASASASGYSEAGSGGEWTYAQLIAGEATGVNPQARETYLSDAEFSKVFGMSKDEFKAMPKWKRVNKKKDVNLF